MARWNAPEEIEKGVNIPELTDENVYFYHDQMHIFWKKLEEGIVIDWTFLEVYLIHKSTVIEMLKRKLDHLYPINNLDHVEFVKDIKELTKIVNYVKQKK